MDNKQFESTMRKIRSGMVAFSGIHFTFEQGQQLKEEFSRFLRPLIDPPEPKLSLKDLKIGAVVTLNSGGPLMTIRSKVGFSDSLFTAVWFDDEGKQQSADFDVVTLSLVEGDK